MTGPGIETVRIAPAVYADGPGLEDPAETYHEASKLAASTAAFELAGATRLHASEELRTSATRAVRRHPLASTIPLGERIRLERPLEDVLAARRSSREFAEKPLTLAELGALLHAAYGVTGNLEPGGAASEQPVRTVPSGGALYPIEIFILARRVHGVPPGVHHYDPLASVLELGPGDDFDAGWISPYEEIERAAVTIAIAATFWRSRFKYGLRAYRFTLLEAGHVAQNVLLAATALGLASLPLGGFYDHRLDDLLGLDGTDQSSLLLVCVGLGP
jgi:SagB-type dehydrogenase family enzyme